MGGIAFYTRGNSFWAKKEKDEDEAGSQSVGESPVFARSVRGPSSERSSRRVEGEEGGELCDH